MPIFPSCRLSPFYAASFAIAGLAAACGAPAPEHDDGAERANAVEARAPGPDAGRTGDGCLPYISYDIVNDPPGGLILFDPVPAKAVFTIEDEFGTVCGSPNSICTRVVSLTVDSNGARLENPSVHGYVPSPFRRAGYAGSFDYTITTLAQASYLNEQPNGPPCPDWTPFDNWMAGDGRLSLYFNGDTGEVRFEQRCVWDHLNPEVFPPEPYGPEDGFLYASSRHHVRAQGQILCPVAP